MSEHNNFILECAKNMLNIESINKETKMFNDPIMHYVRSRIKDEDIAINVSNVSNGYIKLSLRIKERKLDMYLTEKEFDNLFNN